MFDQSEKDLQDADRGEQQSAGAPREHGGGDDGAGCARMLGKRCSLWTTRMTCGMIDEVEGGEGGGGGGEEAEEGT